MGTHGEENRELKFHIMELHEKEGISIKQLSEEYKIAAGTIYNWREQYRKYGDNAFVGCGRQRPEDAELRRLRKENEQLKMQVELLKKLRAYQARIKSGKE